MSLYQKHTDYMLSHLSLPVILHRSLCRSVPLPQFDTCLPTPFLSLLVTLLLLKMSVKEEIAYSYEEYFHDRGPTVTFSNLHYAVQETKLCFKVGSEKYILKDVRYVNTVCLWIIHCWIIIGILGQKGAVF